MRDDARRYRILRGVLLLAKACLITGCIIPFNGPGDIKRDVQHATGNDLDMDFGVTVGRSGMALARWIIKKSDDEGDIPPLEGIKKVEVGVYDVVAPGGGEAPARMLEAMYWPEWMPVVEIHELDESPPAEPASFDDEVAADGETTEATFDDADDGGGPADILILFQYDEEKKDQLRRMLFLVEEDKQLIIVRVSGDLNQLIEQVIAYGLKESNHPEMVDPAIDSYREREGAPPDGDTTSPEAF